MRLRNKIALVTGASRGMGAEIAMTLAREGADVILAARTTEAHETDRNRPGTIMDVAEKIRRMGRRALPVKTDVSVLADVERLVDNAIAEFGRIDILVNSAWYVHFTSEPLSDLMDPNMTEATIGTFKGILDITRIVLPIMKKQRYGRIINITSMGAKNKVPNAPVYAGLKAGVAHFTASVAMAVAASGITINCVAPGVIDTKSTFDLPPRTMDFILQQMIPMRRLGKESDIAQAVLFLADDVTANYITGTTITVDGGISHY